MRLPRPSIPQKCGFLYAAPPPRHHVRMASADDADYAPLTWRLAGMLELYGHGWTYEQIGAQHSIKAATVRDYLRQARLLLDADTVDTAVEEAARRGLIDLTGPRPEPSPPRWQTPDQPSR